MMKFIFRRRQAASGTQEVWDRSDPLSHPAIQRMSQRELADLPMIRH
ncbi:hypothetical protein [Labrenzia sp. 011]|nr:hypothetical protein [Labrenzia sp. 011]